MYRKAVKGIFCVHGEKVEIWSCHLYQKAPAIEVSRLCHHVIPMLHDNLVVVGDFNFPVAKSEWNPVRRLMRPVSESSSACTAPWFTNFWGEKETDNMWVSRSACPEWGSSATVCAPPSYLLAQASDACGYGCTRGDKLSAAVYPDHRLIWADFVFANPSADQVANLNSAVRGL